MQMKQLTDAVAFCMDQGAGGAEGSWATTGLINGNALRNAGMQPGNKANSRMSASWQSRFMVPILVSCLRSSHHNDRSS